MNRKDGEIFRFKDADGNQMYNVVFGRRLKDGHFQVSPSVKSRTFKTLAGAKRAISKFQSSE